ncbi:MAG: 3-hydroxyacyl-CoA dehydrogenase [Rhodococcus sp.]|nr:3-hydroxyacyl-CoA dehydrogenase [Rhodococcus sp. (in: high G+C Gram-positive bacteria)]
MIETIRVIGAGTMGRGIAQTAIAAGVTVELTDLSEQAVTAAVEFITAMMRRSVEKGARTSEEASAALDLLRTGAAPTDATDSVDLVVEAVVERLEVKQKLFAELEKVAPRALLASNTSSIPISAIASVLERPENMIGLHFFNPVPLMKLVEVIPGLRTASANVQAAREFATRLGHTPVLAQDTPGFLVNHLGRALVTEGLALLSEQAASVADIDRIVRDVLGFKMGPFELMDLTGLEVSHPVMINVSNGFYGDPRLRPSPLAEARVTANLLGRKSGEGFYAYADGRPVIPAELAITADSAATSVHVHESPALADALRSAGVDVVETSSPTAVSVVTPLGEPVHRVALTAGLDTTRTIGVDPLSVGTGRLVAVIPPSLEPSAGRAAVQAIAAATEHLTITSDGPAPVAQRILATVVNLGCALAEQSIGSPADIDLGARLGLGYPAGPLELGDRTNPDTIVTILDGLHRYTGDPRYRASGWLRSRAELGMSLTARGTSPHDLIDRSSAPAHNS